MKTQFLGGGMVVAMMTLVLALQSTVVAQPPDGPPAPGEVAAACIRSVTRAANDCAGDNAQVARRCIHRIEELLAAGEVDEARTLARRCIHQIRTQSDECFDAIQQRCQRCIEYLLDLEELELADVVRDACERALMRVRSSQRHAIEAIVEALGE